MPKKKAPIFSLSRIGPAHKFTKRWTIEQLFSKYSVKILIYYFFNFWNLGTVFFKEDLLVAASKFL